jgi:aminoglycoside phosphotransferase (APT) family kinase protein
MLDPQEMPDRLSAFIARRLPGHHEITVDGYEAVAGGFSRLTARFRATIDGNERWLIARGDPPPERATAHTDRNQEWNVLSWLAEETGIPIPAPRFFDGDGSELGTKTIVMDLVDGDPLIRRAAAAGETDFAVLADSMADLAATIHAADTTTLTALERPKDWESYIDRSIAQWREIESGHCEADPFIRYLAVWLDENRPPPAPLRLVHGDFQSTNFIVGTDGGLVALDWELTHIGDPREDLGWCKWNEVIQPPGLMARDEEAFCRRYAERSGLGSDVVNPSTVGYFSVLSAVGACQQAYPAVAACAGGSNTSLITAYVLGYLVTFHEQFLKVTGEIDAARKILEEVR